MKKIFIPLLLLASYISGFAQQKIISGDFNGDGLITVEDVTHLTNVALGKESPTMLCIDPYNGHEYVDLGLSVKWATCNVGATNPEDYGDYFAWGETKPYYSTGHSIDLDCSNWVSDKTGYNWESYKWCKGSKTTLIKYCKTSVYGIVDNKTELEKEDDAAYANWGGNWRMPTNVEQNELLDNCYWEWTSNYNNSGVAGWIVYKAKSDSDKGIKKTSYSTITISASYSLDDKHIFLPQAGYRTDTYLTRKNYGYYSSSSLSTSSNSTGASTMYFEASYAVWSDTFRCLGQSIRAVCQ